MKTMSTEWDGPLCLQSRESRRERKREREIGSSSEFLSRGHYVVMSS